MPDRRVLLFPAHEATSRFIDIPFPVDGGHAINLFVSESPDLRATYGVHASRVKLQGIEVRNRHEAGLNGTYHLFYCVSPSLPPNAFALSCVKVHHPENRLFWRGDMILAKYRPRDRIYDNVLGDLAPAVARVLEQCYLDRRLEQYLEEDRNFLATTTSHLPRYQILREEIRELDAYRTHKILLFPADGSEIRFIPLVFSEEGARAIHSFLYRAPDLWQIFGPAIGRTRLQIINVSTAPNPSVRGEYHMYYSISPNLPINETALRIVGTESPDSRLFWKGDIVIARFGGVSSYLDASKDAVPVIEDTIRKLYETGRLDDLHKQDRELLAHRIGPELPRHRILQEEMEELAR